MASILKKNPPKIQAIKRGESVNKFLAEQLQKYADEDETEERRWRQDRERWLAVVKKHSGHSSARPWTREELYQERFERYPKPSA